MVVEVIEEKKDYEVNHKDMGCIPATKYLGKQSRCLECPFTVCIHDDETERRGGSRNLGRPKKAEGDTQIHSKLLVRARNEGILEMINAGGSRREVAKRYGIAENTVRRILQDFVPANGVKYKGPGRGRPKKNGALPNGDLRVETGQSIGQSSVKIPG